jgi:hypothetical protein
MSHNNRLRRLEGAARAFAPRPPSPTDQEWLESFTEWGKQGLFSDEPDFPAALQLFREDLEAKAQGRDVPYRMDRPLDALLEMAEKVAERQQQERGEECEA